MWCWFVTGLTKPKCHWRTSSVSDFSLGNKSVICGDRDHHQRSAISATPALPHWGLLHLPSFSVISHYLTRQILILKDWAFCWSAAKWHIQSLLKSVRGRLVPPSACHFTNLLIIELCPWSRNHKIWLSCYIRTELFCSTAPAFGFRLW